MDELNRLNIEFVSFREPIGTGGSLGRAIVVIIGAIAELERDLIVERVRAGMHRVKLEDQHIGGQPPGLNREAILRDHGLGQSLGQIARDHRISRATVRRVIREAEPAPQNQVASSPRHRYKRPPKPTRKPHIIIGRINPAYQTPYL